MKLTYKGDESLIKQTKNWVAVIGTRKPTPAEEEMTRKLVQKLVSSGKIIVSGLAYGIDTEAHKMAIMCEGKTVAIVNTPSEQALYPEENRQLGSDIIQTNGLILYPYTTQAKYEKGFNQFQKRLVERDILLAYLCPTIIAVSDDEIIDGGTRWAVDYGRRFGKNVRVVRSTGFAKVNVPTKETNLWWEVEHEGVREAIQKNEKRSDKN